ncbi:MAG TPA: YihY/virulence factor BrkB family protein [Pyrinomonadaceae bacterium]|nr:YihY/virulence factor BrkB family protein [Pyrinomonadaceae bacterium]
MFRTWTTSGLGLKVIARRVWSQIQEDDVWGHAAQLSYYFLLALFPLLLFLMTLFGYFAESSSELRDKLLIYLGGVMPYSAVELIKATLDEVTAQKGGGKLSFGLLAALWAASNGMGAISQTLNVAYEVEERRPWWSVRLVSIGLTLLLALLIISALVIVLYGGRIGDLIAGVFGLGGAFTRVWRVLQWPIAFIFLMIGFSSIYYFAPDLRQSEKRWEWITPGSALAIALWLLISLGFRLYLYFFDSYSATYGSLGALIILMLWFYLTGVAILIGGEINSELARAARKQTRGGIIA